MVCFGFGTVCTSVVIGGVCCALMCVICASAIVAGIVCSGLLIVLVIL